MKQSRLFLLLGCVIVAACVYAATQHVGTASATTIDVNGPKPGGVGLPVHGRKGIATCNEPGHAACPAVDMGWVSVNAETPAAVIAAVMSTPMYKAELGTHGAVMSGLDTPVLVMPYHAHTGVAYYDDAHWIIRVHDANGHDVGTFDFIYDRANHRIAFSSFGISTASDPAYAQPFPALAESDALTALRSARGTTMRAGTVPELIFFPPSARLDPGKTRSPLAWTGGGIDPSRPMWLVQGMDGKSYFIGMDHKTYTDAQLPIAS